MFGLADGVTAAYVAWGVVKGRRRGLSIELPRLTGVTLALVTGTGLLHWSERVLGAIHKGTGQFAGALGWCGGLVGSFYLVRRFRERMAQWISNRWSDEALQKHAGMAAGFLRTFFISSMIVLFLLHTPLAFSVRDSLMGRSFVKIVEPVYHVADKPHN